MAGMAPPAGLPAAPGAGGVGATMAARMGGYGASTADSAGPKNDTININGHTNLKLTLNVHAPTAPDPWVTSQAMPHISHALRGAGHSETVADELTRALGLLAAHGVLQLTQSAAAVDSSSQGWAGEASYGYGNTPARPEPPSNFGASTARPSDYPAPASPSDKQKPQTEKVIEVEEKLVGAVLGSGGRTLVEIQQYSGTRIQISRKGEYAPGTRNRTATIKGCDSGIRSAQYLINQEQDSHHQGMRQGGR